MTFPARVNKDLLYRSPDGREGFVIFDGDGLAHFGQDITFPWKSVGYSVEALRHIVSLMESRLAVDVAEVVGEAEVTGADADDDTESEADDE